MAWLPETCTNCGSERLPGKGCEACLGLTDEAWALRDARDAFAADRIDADELERRIELALTAPPKRYHPRYVYR